MEIYLICFDDHRCLSKSEESKCMWKNGKYGARWEFLKSGTRGVARQRGVGDEGKTLLVALFKNSHMVPSLPCVHIHLLSFDWKRHLWSSKYIKYVPVCLYVSFLQRSLHFFGNNFPFIFPFCVLSVLRCYPFHVV